MAELSENILSAQEVKDNFTLTDRPMGPVLLHNTLPIYIVEYDEFPKQKQPRHWQVYYSPETTSREPWRESNRRLNGKQYGYQKPEDAIFAAMQKAQEFPGGARGYE
jgi:hypothetical protein